MFQKILIANRGEIACRVIRTCRQLGIRTVAVYSDADAGSLFVREADEAWRLGPAPARESYLNTERLLAIARESGAEAIHPGYGFLSENADFARACQRAGLVFIGPPPEAIAAMGSKSAAKQLMSTASVPLVPGYHGSEQAADFLAQEARRIGFPVLIKATLGGGGKGMRIVERAEDFPAALASCQREALAAFGSEEVLLERYLTRPRHIEMQVFADRHGQCVHLHERDCSVQRRHQKVLEEAPAPGLDPARRAAMGEAACAAARAVGYEGAGTVEFIVDTTTGEFFFMEMNTRLQVEHPVTEMITGLDLVEWQLRVAAGETLPLAQADIPLHGHAIEARLYAEDPDKGFLPATGRLDILRWPATGSTIRIDSGVAEGDAVSPFYDPMLAKLIVHGRTRDEALARLHQALADIRLAGITTNIAFLSRLIALPAFTGADLDTGLITREEIRLFPPATPPAAEVLALALLAGMMPDASPWHTRPLWRLNGQARLTGRFAWHGQELPVSLTPSANGWLLPDGRRLTVTSQQADRWQLILDEQQLTASVFALGPRRIVYLHGQRHELEWLDPLAVSAMQEHAGSHLRAPMPGRVVAWLANAGATVDKGTPLLVLEAMKMEHTLTAPRPGRVLEYYYRPGEQVQEGADLLDFATE